MFRGASAINLDTKGRFAIPVRYREPLQLQHLGRIVITVDIVSSCLLLYPLHEWELVEAKLLELSDTDPTHRSLKRLLLGYAHEVELDANGRVLLPPPLRHYANLDKRIMLVGQLNKFELWDEQAWLQQIDECQQTIRSEELANNARLADFSL
ncbi:MAG: division/cell wall cluster transcriptional repressor MraZ [Shewanella sp.]